MISIIIPVYNEDESVALLHGEIQAAAQGRDWQYEVLFIDDGSADRSWPVIAELAGKHPEVHGIRLRRNFGKAAALSAGLAAARGEII
jgi:glycosyltransferase involved in cell wall biosynthesis